MVAGTGSVEGQEQSAQQPQTAEPAVLATGTSRVAVGEATRRQPSRMQVSE